MCLLLLPAGTALKHDPTAMRELFEFAGNFKLGGGGRLTSACRKA